MEQIIGDTFQHNSTNQLGYWQTSKNWMYQKYFQIGRKQLWYEIHVNELWAAVIMIS